MREGHKREDVSLILITSVGLFIVCAGAAS